jgi:hypothetical protein
MGAPRRVNSDITMTCLTSFIEYVNRHKESSTIIRFSTDSHGSVEVLAIIDFHASPVYGKDEDEDELLNTNTPKWGSHKVRFFTEATPAWQEWQRASGKFVSQSEFADFIYQNMKEVVQPNGADLLEIVQTLKATSKGEFRDMKELNDLTDEMTEVISAVRATGKVGKISVTLGLYPRGTGNSQMEIRPSIKGVAPEMERRISLFYVNSDDGLQRDDPLQNPLPGVKSIVDALEDKTGTDDR